MPRSIGVVRRILTILLVAAVVSPSASFAVDCRGFLRILGVGTLAVGKETGKTLYYPLLFAKRALEKDGSLAGRVWKKDRWRAGIFVFLQALSHLTSVSYGEFEKKTAAFDDAVSPGIEVVVDAFPQGDPLYPAAGTYIFEKKYKGRKNVFLIRPASPKDLCLQLQHLRSEHGPIGKLDFYGHGYPASLQGFFHQGEFLQNGMAASHLFAAGAHVRFNSCFVGNGEGGSAFLDFFAKTFLPNGGTVYASSLQLTANPVEYLAVRFNTPEPPRWLRWAAQPMKTPLGLWTAVELMRLPEGSRFPPAERVVTREYLHEDKTWIPRALKDELQAIESSLWSLTGQMQDKLNRGVDPAAIRRKIAALSDYLGDAHGEAERAFMAKATEEIEEMARKGFYTPAEKRLAVAQAERSIPIWRNQVAAHRLWLNFILTEPKESRLDFSR